ncbi:MAG: hypothetical protein IPM04_01680 [Saprospiraceae bacterium]|nr:hypothetical protein [Candidatus Brachybacter algidus]MBK8746593.1 hypothetical protein [Candidatus Brachybacter algidus]
MSTKNKFLSSSGIYFISFEVVDWIDVFTCVVKKYFSLNHACLPTKAGIQMITQITRIIPADFSEIL